MKGVIDRFEGNFAVILFGDDETKVDIPRQLLPEEAKEGSWLNFRIELDPEGEKKQKVKIQELLDKLKSKQTKR